jgi:hypothetical protein
LKDDSVAVLELTLGFRRAWVNHPDLNWNDAMSSGQITSKLWLIETVEDLGLDLGKVFLLGGWLGVLPALMFQRGIPHKGIRSFDMDPTCAAAAEDLNRSYVMDSWRFKAATADMFDLDYAQCTYTTHRRDGSAVTLTEAPDTIINTSCDHIAPFADWWGKIPDGKLVILQNNDFAGADEDHVNTVSDLDAMIEQALMSELLFSGTLALPEYNRFMLIGRK